MTEKKSKATKKSTSKKKAVKKSTLSSKKKVGRPKKTVKKSAKKTVSPKTKVVKSEAKVREVKVGDLEKLYLPVAIILAGLFIGCGLMVGILYNGGAFSRKEDYQCNSFEPLSNDCLKSYAQESDLNFSTFEKCLDEQTHYDVIETDVEALKDYGIEGTPHVVIGEINDGKLRGFYAGGAQGYDYYENLIDKIKESGVEEAHEDFIAENLGSLEDLTARYEEAYRTQFTGEDLSESEIKELSSMAAESRFDAYGIKEYDIENSVSIGDENADIAMLEYSDYDCSYCKSFAEETFPDLNENYIKDDKLLFIYKSLPLEETPGKGFRAANAAKCADDQGKFLQYHNLLFGIGSSE